MGAQIEDSISMDVTEKAEGTTRASLELLYHISREFAAALDLRTVLQRVVLLSMQTVGAMSGSIIVMDGNGKPVESAMVTGSQILSHTTQRLRVTLEKGLAGWVARNHKAVLISDTSHDERWVSSKYAVDEEIGSKSAVSAPLLVRDSLVGVMTLVHQTPGFFTQEHLALVQAIADQAGIAVLNGRLYEESQRQARAMTALAESATAITASLDLEDVLERILAQISQALQVKAVSLALIDQAKNELIFNAAVGWVRTDKRYARLALGQGFAGWVAQMGEGAIVPDAQFDPHFDPEINMRTGISVTAVACAPIRSQGEVIGILEALNPIDGVFDPDALLVLSGIGGLAGTAIRHAQLFGHLEAAHQRYRELFEDSIDPILITNWDGKILEANRQAVIMADTDRQNLLNKSINQLHEIDQEKVGQHFKNLTSGMTVTYESVLQTSREITVPIQVYVRQVKIEDMSNLQWIFRDITERKNLDTLREDLLSMIYHDLQSPLANVVSSLDVIHNLIKPDEDPTFKSLIEIASRSTQRIQRLTNSLLDINRLEAGQPVGNRQPARPAALAQDAIDIVLPITQGRNQDLRNEVPPDLPLVSVDADMIRRVITNLLDNAAKYTGPGSQIRVGGEQDGDRINMWVQDNGPGIPESDHQRIFEKFARLKNRGATKGLGLGLAYCRLAVEGHGGKIWVESKPGSGSCFMFTLPGAKPPS
jgi:NtrC-family two-component system sensor histidine kinase KinB